MMCAQVIIKLLNVESRMELHVSFEVLHDISRSSRCPQNWWVLTYITSPDGYVVLPSHSTSIWSKKFACKTFVHIKHANCTDNPPSRILRIHFRPFYEINPMIFCFACLLSLCHVFLTLIVHLEWANRVFLI